MIWEMMVVSGGNGYMFELSENSSVQADDILHSDMECNFRDNT